MRKKAVPYCAVAVTAAVALLGASQARGATSDQAVVSQNWAGYEAAASSTDQRFSKVSGSWVQPKADCSTGEGDAAFWVGLGGGDDGAQGLEQVGTEVDCSSGQAESHAWYELIPAAPVNLDVAVNPGDHVSASVNVDGNNVTVSLKNDTTGKSQTKDLSTDNIDVSTAEWIAEAPSQCDSAGGCTPVALADFGSIGFTSSSATANGHTGSISDSAWSSAPLQLSSVDGSSGGAAPGSLSSDGTSFSVSYQSADAQVTNPNGGTGSVNPYGGGDPYGDGGGASPYGDGSGGYGDGSGAYPYGGGDPYGVNPYDDGGSGYGWDGSYGGGYSFAY